ncbi:MAG: Asp-tRNA(Asn)/Glu-tRNA(Gln) amidotransferase subunit GatA [Aquificaceae bacterium]
MIWSLPAYEIARLVKSKELSPKEVLSAFFERFQALEPKLNAFITPTFERALKEAENLEPSSEMLLAGVPVALKDNINQKGVETTCGSKLLQNSVAVFDATVVSRLRAEGAVFVGKTNMDEFAMGSSTEYSAFFKTRNPWDIERVPGGSSGGSAVSVAARMSPLALGSDTGGSVRQPASFCGVIGLKPTYGRVSRYGLVAFASSLDQIGPFAFNCKDLALIMKVIAGFDKRDSTSSNLPVEDYLKEVENAGVRNLRVAVPRFEGVETNVRECFDKFLKKIEQDGAKVEEIELKYIHLAINAYYVIAPCEASSNLARFDGIRYGNAVYGKDIDETYKKTRSAGFGKEVKRRILMGTFALSSGYYDAYYLKAMKVRTLIANELKSILRDYDLIITPTTPTRAFKFGEKTSDPVSMYLSDIFTVSVNLAGLPAVSLPLCVSEGLPCGVQLIAGEFSEGLLMRVCGWWEGVSGFSSWLSELAR